MKHIEIYHDKWLAINKIKTEEYDGEKPMKDILDEILQRSNRIKKYLKNAR